MDLENIGINIKRLRKGSNLTQEQLAQHLGLAGKSSVMMYEKGKATPSLKIIWKLSKLYNVSIDSILDGRV